MSDHLFVFARITPKTEFFDDAKAAIIKIIASTRKEEGCHDFKFYEGRGDGNLYLYEEWESQAALDCHYAMPYTKAVFESYDAWLASPVEVTKLTQVN